MAINLASKYAGKIEQAFTHDSYVKGHCKAQLEFTGVKTVKVYMLNTTPLNDYKRSGSNRYGEMKDVEDTVIEYTMTQDKSFTGVVDKGDEKEQTISNKAGQWLRQQIREQVVPTADKYAFGKIANYGHVAVISAAPTKSNIVTEIFNARTYFNNHRVPNTGRYIFVKASYTPLIMLSDEWKGLDNLAGKQLPTGVVGRVAGFTVVEVPDDMLAENHYFTAIHESAVAYPYKINSSKIHTDPVGISGAVIEGRQLYDVFVLGSKANAVYSLVKSNIKLATPTITDESKDAVTLASSGASKIYYTLDGSDPRFSESRDVHGSGINITAYCTAEGLEKATLKAVAMDTEGKFSSDIAVKEIAKS